MLPLLLLSWAAVASARGETTPLSAAIEARDAAGAEAAMIGHIRKTAACAGVLV
mgnify:CR=1 FL=1